MAESIALAFLENMIRRQGVGFNDDFRIMIIGVPNDLTISEVPAPRLDENWLDFNDHSSCRVLGDEWYTKRKSLVLKVPSAVLAESSNYVIHTEHSDFNRVEIVGVTNLIPDQRIEEILKQHADKK